MPTALDCPRDVPPNQKTYSQTERRKDDPPAKATAECVLIVLANHKGGVTKTTSTANLGAMLVVGSLLIATGGAFFALNHDALWDAFVAMAIIGSGFAYTFAALPGMITRSIPGDETGSAMGLYQVVRYIGFSLGSAFAPAIVASHTIDHGTRVLESGFVTGLWIAAGICAVSAVVSWRLSRRPKTPAPDALQKTELERLEYEDAELAAVGVTVDPDIKPPG